MLGRFLSPDPYVQDPTNGQNFNRYSYCLNNPLKYTDVTGEAIYSTDYSSLWKKLLTHLKEGGSVNNFEPYGWDVQSDNGDVIGIYSYNDQTGIGYVLSFGVEGRGGGGSGSITSPRSLPTIVVTNMVYRLNTWFDVAALSAGTVGLSVDIIDNIWQGIKNENKNQLAHRIQVTIKDSSRKTVPTKTIKGGITKGLKVTGKGLGYIQGGVIVADILINQEVNPSHLLDGIITGLSIGVPGVGWIIGGVYFVGDIAIGEITGQSIGDHLNNVVGTSIISW